MSESPATAIPRPQANARLSVPLGNTWPFAVMVGSAVMGIGMLLDVALGGRGLPAPGWPANGWLLLAFVLMQVGGFAALRGSRLFEGLAGTRLAVVALVFVGAWAMALGTLPQVLRGEEAPIYQRVMQAPPFVGLLLLLLANLGWGMLRHVAGGLRASSLLLFSHAGVYVAVIASLFGSGDTLRLDVWVTEDDLVWTGTKAGQTYELPFAVHLHAFTIQNFPPQLTLLDGQTGASLLAKREDQLILRPGVEGTLQGIRIRAREVTDAAPWSAPGDPVAAAYLFAEAPDGRTSEGWVSSGSNLMPPVFLGLGTVSLVMPEPRPREFASRLTLVQPDQPPREVVIRVNEPLRLGPWWLYQRGYRLDGTRSSHFEAVHDPWLPAVYTGLGLLAIGALLTLGRAAARLREGPALIPEERP